ncbi:MAG: hypothetical protein LKM34_04530 [Prevotella sp.]|nr:hypothetical protein [Prevotella sp.]
MRSTRRLLKYGVLTSVLLASMYASHTLIAYPIVLRYGLVTATKRNDCCWSNSHHRYS